MWDTRFLVCQRMLAQSCEPVLFCSLNRETRGPRRLQTRVTTTPDVYAALTSRATPDLSPEGRKLDLKSAMIGGAGPGAPMAPAVAVKPMSVDEKNRAIRARAVAEAKK